jgi:sec-independent protein translocase protein TatA
MFGMSELVVILIVVIAVLAVRKLPELTRSAGKSARILKAEARAAQDEPGEAPQVIQGQIVTEPGRPGPAGDDSRRS